MADLIWQLAGRLHNGKSCLYVQKKYFASTSQHTQGHGSLISLKRLPGCDELTSLRPAISQITLQLLNIVADGIREQSSKDLFVPELESAMGSHGIELS